MAATGQEMAYRCEQCGSPRSSLCPSYTSRGLAASLDASPRASASLYCEGSFSAETTRLPSRLFGMGIPYSSLLLLGAPRIECNIAAFKSTISLEITVAVLLFFGLYAHLEIAL